MQRPLWTEDAPQDASGVNRRAGINSTVDVGPIDEPAMVHQYGPALPIVERGSYLVLDEFAKGGIGRILSAQDPYLDRPVALKELLDVSPDAEERFVREALITARLQHPSIVPIYQAGRWPTGEPFYAMRLVSGRSLAEAIERAPTLAERLALLPHVLAVAEAVAYAHGQRIIHRDLKPQNVLLGEFGETIVIDWGLAKILDGSSRSLEEKPVDSQEGDVPPIEGAGLTVQGAIMGTPLYMSPEQALGLPVDEQADVYALGAILYHVLAGSPPYEGRTTAEILNKVLYEVPMVLEQRQAGVPKDLRAIVQKAMHRELEQRYRTAKEVAEDLRRFQTGQLVGAHSYSFSERLRRFARRNRTALGIATVALVVIVVGGLASINGILEARARAERKQVEAEAAEQRATTRADDLTLLQAKAALSQDPSASLAWLKSVSPSFDRWGALRIIAADAFSRGIPQVFRDHTAAVGAIAFSPDGSMLVSVSDDRTVLLRDLRKGETRTLSRHDDEVWAVAFSLDGKMLATGSKDKTIHLHNLEYGTERVLRGHEAWVDIVSFSPDGKLLATVAQGDKVWLWDVATGQGRPITQTKSAEGVAFSPDGNVLAFAEDGALVRFDITSGRRMISPGLDAGINEVAFSPDGTQIVTAGRDGAVMLWGTMTETSTILYRHEKGQVTHIAFAANGQHIMSLGYDDLLRVWDIGAGAMRTFKGHSGYIRSMTVSRDGEKVATAGGDGDVRLWDIATGESRAFHGFVDSATAVGLSPDGGTIVGGGGDGTIRKWTMKSHNEFSAATNQFTRAVFSPDGMRAATLGEDGLLRVTTFPPGNEPSESIVLPGPATKPHRMPVPMEPGIRFSADGQQIASAFDNGTVRVYQITGHDPQILRGHEGQALCLAFSPDGKYLVSGGNDGMVRLWELATGEGKTLSRHTGEVTGVVFAPDGRSLASSGVDGIVRISNLTTGGGKDLLGHRGPVVSMTMSPDGTKLVSGGNDRSLRIWDLASGRSIVRDDAVVGLRRLGFFPDGHSFISLGSFTPPQVWDAQTGESRVVLRGHTSIVVEMAISKDAQRITTASADGTVRLWDVATGESRVLGSCSSDGAAVAFGADGRLIRAASFEGSLKLWADALPTEPEGLRAWLITATAETIERLLGRNMK